MGMNFLKMAGVIEEEKEEPPEPAPESREVDLSANKPTKSDWDSRQEAIQRSHAMNMESYQKTRDMMQKQIDETTNLTAAIENLTGTLEKVFLPQLDKILTTNLGNFSNYFGGVIKELSTAIRGADEEIDVLLNKVEKETVKSKKISKKKPKKVLSKKA